MSDQLSDRIHPRSTRVHRDDVLAVLSEDLFRRRAGLSHRDRIDLLYRRLRRLDSWDAFTDEPKDADGRYHALMEQVVLVDPALWIAGVVHFGVGQGALKRFPELPDVRAVVRRLKARGEVVVFLVTELGNGGGAASSRTVARFDSSSRRFHLSTPDVGAIKTWANVAAPGIPKVAVVAAVLVDSYDNRCGRFYFVVPLRDELTITPGVTIVPAEDDSAVGLDAGHVSFDDVPVPYGSWLRGGASLDASGAFSEPSPGERVRRYLAGTESEWIEVSRASASIARAASAMTARFTTVRQVADPHGRLTPAIGFRSVQEPVLGALASALALTFLVNHGLDDDVSSTTQPGGGDSGPPMLAFRNDLAILKITSIRTAEDVVRRSRERCGALGLLPSTRLVEYGEFLERTRWIGGDNHVLALEIARSLLESRGTPTRGGDETDGDPGDLPYWLALARRREHALLDAVETVDGASGDFRPSNDSLSLADSAVTALGERLLIEAFAREVSGPAGAGHRVLQSCALLFAVDTFGDRHDTRLRQIRYRCHDEILAGLDHLVAALDVPQALVGAPLMDDDYVGAVLGAVGQERR